MKISFNLDVNDWVAFQIYFRGKKTPLQNLAAPLVIICAVLMVTLNAFYIHYEGVTLLAYISSLILVILLYLLYTKKRTAKQLYQSGTDLKKKHPEAFGQMTMEFSETGIEIQSMVSSKSLTWEDMSSYDENKDYFYLYSKKGMAYIIPKKDLNADLPDFEVLLQKSFLKSKNG